MPIANRDRLKNAAHLLQNHLNTSFKAQSFVWSGFANWGSSHSYFDSTFVQFDKAQTVLGEQC